MTLALEGIRVRRDGRSILEVEHLELVRGEVLALLGPNGAGKSTLLRVAALLDRPDEGAVRLDGRAARPGDRAAQRRFGVVLQRPLLLRGSVRYNVELPLRLRGAQRSERRGRVEAALELLGIAHLAGRRGDRLSGGEAQRVSIARALVTAPDVLFLDEPTAGLDPPARAALLRDVLTAVRERDVALLLVTHDRLEAQTAGRVAVLLAGRLRQVGSAGEVFGRPADQEVAQFLGLENLWEGTVTAARDGLLTVACGGLKVYAVGELPPGVPVRYCVRADEVTVGLLAASVPSSARNHVAGTVRSIAQRGMLRVVELDAGGVTIAAAVTRPAVEDLAIAPGVTLAATWKATAAHLIPVERAPAGRARPSAAG